MVASLSAIGAASAGSDCCCQLVVESSASDADTEFRREVCHHYLHALNANPMLRLITKNLVVACSLAMLSSGPTAAQEPSIRLQNVLKPKVLHQDDHAAVVSGLAFQPDGDYLATAGDDHRVRLWNVKTGKLVATLSGHDDWVRAVKFSRDGRYLASAAADGKLIVWDLKNRTRRTAVGTGSPLTALALTSDGQHFVAVGFKTELFTIRASDAALVTRVACKCRDMRAVTISPDGYWLAGGGRDGKLYLWSTDQGRLARTIAAHGQRIRAIAFSPDGKQMYTGGEDRLIRVWDVSSGQELARLDSGTAKVLSLCVVGIHRLASAGSDNLIRIWDLQSKQEIDRMKGHTGSIAALATNGRFLASAGFDTTVRLWKLTEPTDIIETVQRADNARHR